ncbi:MAG TPA: helicase-related protein [Gemmatimonadales bacterium]|nr:helicase-related protein [Gemmatimonadales bacterium]
MPSNSMAPIAARWPRILSEHLVPVPEPLAFALAPGGAGGTGGAPPRDVVSSAARALLDCTPLAPNAWPAWLAPHQVPAAERLTTIIARHGGALLADEVGLGKSYVALAVALARREPFALVVPAVLVPQWRTLLERFGVHDTPIITHESLSVSPVRQTDRPTVAFVVVDEAHRFRNPDTNRYRALARLVVRSRVLLITATPIHNCVADLLHLLRLFLRDHAFAALGVPSLRNAARREADRSLAPAAVARVIVARSRERVQTSYDGGPVSMVFPRSTTEALRVGPGPEALISDLVAGVAQLRAGGGAAPLLRLMLLRRLGSSLSAFRVALTRHDAYLDLATRAAAEGRALTPREFQRCFPRAAESDIQLVLFPLLLEHGGGGPAPFAHDRRILSRLRGLLARPSTGDPKADALERLLAERAVKTIVFTDAQPTARYLLQRLRHRRVAAVFGHGARFATGDAPRQEVLRAFAPRAQGGSRPVAALETDVLIATDLLSEGLNLQDAERVVHYDLPWSPARLAQRVGRIDRLGSSHSSITTVTFLPPPPLARALAIEERLARKTGAQQVAGTNGRLDWCDQLATLASSQCRAPVGSCAAVVGELPCTVLVVRIAKLVEAIVVEGETARTNPAAATRILAAAGAAEPVAVDRQIVQKATDAAAPLIRSRLAAVQDARWRASDRDRFARRLIPWVLSAARRAARRGDGEQLSDLDALVSRLAAGMTAGEELLLEDLLSRPQPLLVPDLLAWHHALPPADAEDSAIKVELVAALMVVA